MNSLYIIIVLYFILIIFLGFYFRKDNKTPSAYLKANGSLPWLWVGASAFISQFSAWTFTVGAAEAYSNGYNILITFWGNAISFLIAGLYFAKKIRQLRVNNSVEAVQLRFGKINAWLLVLVNVPNFLIFPAIWLNSLSVFIGGALNVKVSYVIIVVGLITLLMSVVGGAWAVVSSDFIQMIIVMVLSVFCAIIAFNKFQSLGGLLHAIPLKGNFEPKSSQSFLLYFLWIGYMFMQKFAGTNTVNNVQRFNTVDSSKSATKAAYFTAIIYIVGSFIWFVPAWFVSTQFADLSVLYPNLRRPQEAAYLAFVQNYMPLGILGIVIVAMFSATMSSIDSSLNWCSGYVMGIMKNSKTKVLIGKISTIVFGFIIIILALYYNSLWDISFFDLTYKLITYIYMPLVIPMILCIWIKRTPDWGFATSVIIGLILSWILAGKNGDVLWNNLLHNLFNIQDPSKKDITHISLFATFILQCIICGGSFILSTLFFKDLNNERTRDIELFYRRLNRNVNTNTITAKRFAPKFRTIHTLTLIVLASVTIILVVIK